jgi:4a-hydroxytetrahydrobiopterin dehydratase
VSHRVQLVAPLPAAFDANLTEGAAVVRSLDLGSYPIDNQKVESEGTMTETLTEGQVQDWLTAHPQWRREQDSLVRAIEAPTFPDGITLVSRVADVAEQRNHHPDIDIRWRTVTFRLSTHSAGGITEADLDLAVVIDQLAA